MGRPVAGQMPTVYRENMAGDEGGGARAEPDSGFGLLTRGAEAADRLDPIPDELGSGALQMLERALAYHIEFGQVNKVRIARWCVGRALRSVGRVEEALAVQRAFFARYVSLPFDDAAAEKYGSVRADLEVRGQLIGANDLLIAAVALAHDVTLVTHNTSEFSRIRDLKLEDWEAT